MIGAPLGACFAAHIVGRYGIEPSVFMGLLETIFRAGLVSLLGLASGATATPMTATLAALGVVTLLNYLLILRHATLPGE